MNMNVYSGGKQAIIRDTAKKKDEGHCLEWQRMAFTRQSTMKGMKLALQEHGINAKGLNAEKREKLSKCEDMSIKTTMLNLVCN